MFENFNPTKRNMGDVKMNRRSALSGIGALFGASTMMGAASLQPSRAIAANSMNLDFSKAEDNLTAWVKLASSLEDGQETCGFFSGTQYAVVGTQEVIQPLFRIQGFGMSRVTRLPDGRYENLHREVVYYLDLKKDEILETWHNPFIDETVEVFSTHNDPVNSHYATRFKQSFGAEDSGIETIEFPFILPWEIFDDRAIVSFSVNTRWPSPLPADKWPREQFGEWYRTSEYFQIHASLADLNNPDLQKVKYTGAWQKVAPWHPWMLMSNAEGGIVGITNVFSLHSTDDLPPHILAYTEKNYPKFLHAPEKWIEPNMATWETFAKERKPVPYKK